MLRLRYVLTAFAFVVSAAPLLGQSERPDGSKAPAIIPDVAAAPVAAGTPSTASSKADQKLQTGIYRLPPDFFTSVDAENRDGVRKPTPPVRLVEDPVHPSEPRYDVREYLKAGGIVLPAEGEATYVPGSGILLVRAKQDDLTAVESLVGGAGIEISLGLKVRHTFTLVEFEVAGDLAEAGGLGYRDLRKKAGGSWHELQCISFDAHSGQSAIGSNVMGGDPPLQPAPTDPRTNPVRALPPLLPKEYGVRCEVEPQVGPDGQTCDIGYSVQWRAKLGEPALELQSNTAIWESYPAILQLVTAPVEAAIGDKTRKLRAVILSVRLINNGDWPAQREK